MSPWLQVLLGFLPALAVLTVFIAVRRFKSFTAVVSWVLTAGLLAGAVACSVTGVPYISGVRESGAAVKRRTPAALADDHLELAYAMMERGEYDEAADILEGYLESYPYSDKYILAAARLRALDGDVEAAAGLYSLLKEGGEAGLNARGREETASLLSCMEGSSGGAWEELCDVIREVAEKIKNGSDEAVLDAVAAWELVQRASSGDESPEERLETVRELGAWSRELRGKENDILSVPFVRDTALKASALSGDYTYVLESVGERAGADSLLITAELIGAGAITNGDVRETDSFSSYEKDSSAVWKWAEEQLEKGAYTEDEQKVIKDILDRLSGLSDSSGLAAGWIENEILAYLEERLDPEASKLYLELAKLRFAAGDPAAVAYLYRALGEAGSSGDAGYARAARELLDVIRDPEDTEARKQIPVLVDRLTEGVRPDVVETAVELNPTGGSPDEPDGGSDDGDSGGGGIWGQLPGLAGPDGTDDHETPEEPAAPDDPDTPDDPDSPDGTVEPDLNESFDQYVTDTVNQIAGSVNILSVDASAFDTVTALISAGETLVSTPEQFKDVMELSDCSTRIREYEVRKVLYSEVNIALVCDTSGSMEGEKIADLREALTYFVDKTGDANIAIVPFSSEVGVVRGFGSGAASLKEGIGEMNALGGTNISAGVTYALGLFPNDSDALNVLIVMSDGQDSRPSQQVLETVTSACREKSVAVYAMGLGGDVDSGVLNSYARVGGGSYMYVSDASSLRSFYDYIYRLCRNRYEVTYTAVDTVKTTRTLDIRAVGNAGVQDQETYYLTGSDISGDDLGEIYDVFVNDSRTVMGLESRLMYRCGVDQITNLLVSGFRKDDQVEVELSGGVSYTLPCEFVDGNTYRVTVPGSVAIGAYDVFVTVNGRRIVFNSGFVMTSRDRRSIRFGSYVFTGSQVAEEDGVITLSGVVDMNGWLNFQGDVILRGDPKNDYDIRLTFSDAYVQYRDDGTATGLAKTFAKQGLILRVPDVSDVTIYNDITTPPDSEDYPVDRYYSRAAVLPIAGFVHLTGLAEYVYPDRVMLDFDDIDLTLPFLNAVIKRSGDDDLFAFKNDHTQKITFTHNSIDFDLEANWKLERAGDVYTSLGNLQIYVKDPSVELKLHTGKGEASIKVGVDVALLSDGVALELGWKDWKLDAVKLYADKDIHSWIGNVPVTFSDFMAGVTDLSRVENMTVAELAKARLTGSFDCSVAKVSEVFPGLEKYIKKLEIKDPAVASLDDTTVELRLNQFYLSVNTTAKLLEFLEIGSARLQMGTGIEYTNMLLGMNGESVTGIVGELSAGLNVDERNFKLISKGTLTVALTDKLVGVTVDGNVEVEISWWIFSAGVMADGELYAGIYRQHNGNWQFVVYAYGQTDSGKRIDPLYWPTDALSSKNF